MSFFAKVKNAFAKLFSKVPSWSQHAQSVITLVAPLTNTILAFIDPQAAPEAAAIIHEVQSDLATAAAFASQAHGSDNAGTLANTLGAVKDNLAALLAGGHIKNADTLNKVTAISNTIIDELQAVIAILPKAA